MVRNRHSDHEDSAPAPSRRVPRIPLVPIERAEINATETTGRNCERVIGFPWGTFRAKEQNAEDEEHPSSRGLAHVFLRPVENSLVFRPIQPHQGDARGRAASGLTYVPSLARLHTHSAPSSMPTLSAKVWGIVPPSSPL